MAAIRRILCAGPLVILLAWRLTGQSELAGPETRAWIQFAGVICLASLVPLPGTSWSFAEGADRLQWWGWLAVIGLVATS